MNGSDSIILKPIGFIETPWGNPSSLPRQPTRQPSTMTNFAFIRWEPGYSCSLLEPKKITLLFSFHQNQTWKPLVQPPRGSSGQKKGVFATRAPYRPNGIGLSVVTAVASNNQGVWIESHDLIHGTPILSIEILPTATPQANSGWIEELTTLNVSLSARAQSQIDFLKNLGEFELESAIQVWLSNDPLNFEEKRVKILSEHKGVFSYRTWRVEFEVSALNVKVLNIYSGYLKSEISDSKDPYFDKSIHRKFVECFDL